MRLQATQRFPTDKATAGPGPPTSSAHRARATLRGRCGPMQDKGSVRMLRPQRYSTEGWKDRRGHPAQCPRLPRTEL